jgi:quinolinate synthase
MQLVAESPVRSRVSVASFALWSGWCPVKEELSATAIDQMIASHAKTYSSESMF